MSIVRCEIEVIAAGNVAIAIGDSTGLDAWIGTRPLKLDQGPPLDLAKGRHRLTITVDRGSRTRPLGLTIDEATTANARFVTGK